MSRWRRLTLVLLPCLLLLPPFAVPAPQEKAQPEVRSRLGTWNIEWLGNPAKRRKAAQKAEDIAAYIAASKVELLGLNEISIDGEADGLLSNRTLVAACKLLRGRDRGDWRHLRFPSADKENKDQVCGVARNASRWSRVGK